MRLNRPHRDVELNSDRFVGPPLCQLQKDCLLAPRQCLAFVAGFWLQRPFGSCAKITLAAHDSVDGLLDLVRWHVFEHITHCAVRQGRGDVFRAVVHRQDQDSGVGGFLQQDFSRGQAAQFRHVKIHQDNIRFQMARLFNNLAPV